MLGIATRSPPSRQDLALHQGAVGRGVCSSAVAVKSSVAGHGADIVGALDVEVKVVGGDDEDVANFAAAAVVQAALQALGTVDSINLGSATAIIGGPSANHQDAVV